MRTLVLRIYLTLVAVLLLFALAGGAIVKHQFEQQRESVAQQVQDRLAGWAGFAQSVLPDASASTAEQAAAVEEFARRWRVPLALEDARGERIATSAGFERREAGLAERASRDGRPPSELAERRAVLRLALPDGRLLLVWRERGRWGEPATAPGQGARGPWGESPPHPEAGLHGPMPGGGWRGPGLPFGWPIGPAGGLALVLGLLFIAVAAAAWPVARRLTRRLETLERGVDAFGSGQLQQRVAVEGRDEISSLARSFNHAADRIESLIQSNRSLLANASHEIRSPLARLKMAVSMLDEAADPAAPPLGADRRQRLRSEVHANIAELDALVDEVLLASRLDAQPGVADPQPVDLVDLVEDEATRLQSVEPGARFELDWRPPGRDGTPGASAPAADVAADDGAADRSVDRAADHPADPRAFVVRGDARLLRRAVRNLLENARRYGGGWARARLELAPSRALLVIDDRGPGVPAPLRERIFEPFFRLPGHAEQHGGVGLGLSLVRQIAQRHGGSVRCEGRPEGGSRFILELPC
jgi:signal transduction histidine kinase